MSIIENSTNLTNNSTNFINEKRVNSILLTTGIISIIIIILVVIFIIYYCLKRSKEENQIENNENINQKIHMGNNNEKYSFKQIQNNSNISNHENNINMSLSEIKEKNLKDEIQNIIQNSYNKNEPIDLEKGEKIEKKNKKKKK